MMLIKEEVRTDLPTVEELLLHINLMHLAATSLLSPISELNTAYDKEKAAESLAHCVQYGSKRYAVSDRLAAAIRDRIIKGGL